MRSLKSWGAHIFICAPLFLFGVQVAQAAPLGLDKNFPDFFVGSPQTFNFDYNCATCSANTGKLTITGGVTSYTEDPTNPGLSNLAVANGAFSSTVFIDNSGNVVGDSGGNNGTFTLNGIVLDNAGDLVPGAIMYNGFTGATWDTSLPCDSTSCTPALQNGGPTGNLLSGEFDKNNNSAGEGFGWQAQPGTGNGTGGIIELTFVNAGGLIAAGPLYTQGFWPHNNGGMIMTVSTITSLNGVVLNCDPPTPDPGCAGWDFDTDLLTNDWTGEGFGDVFVPIPAAVWLFGSSLLGLAGFVRRRTDASS